MTLRDWVAVQHKGQLVKGTYLPYLHHLDFVAEAAKYRVDFGYECGLCHDLLEKTNVTADELRKALAGFGCQDAAASLIVQRVTELTDVFTKENYPELSKKERKCLEAERLIAISPAAQTIKYADLIYNMGWVMTHESRALALKYLARKQALLTEMKQGDAALHATALALTNKA